MYKKITYALLAVTIPVFNNIVSHENSQKVLIITHACTTPYFIKIQDATFKKFLEDEYEFVVFNDARNPVIRKEIDKTCKELGLRCISIAQEIHDRPYLHRFPGEDNNHSSVRTSNVIQYSLDILGFKHNGIVTIIDSDMFLVKKFSVIEYLKNHDIAGVTQSRGKGVHYLWNGLVFLNMNTLPNKETINFNCGQVEGVSVDTAGHLHYYLHGNPQVKTKHIGIMHIGAIICDKCPENQSYTCKHANAAINSCGFNAKTVDFIHQGPKNIEFLLNGTFLHYRGGANWDNQSQAFHATKRALVQKYIDTITK